MCRFVSRPDEQPARSSADIRWRCTVHGARPRNSYGSLKEQTARQVQKNPPRCPPDTKRTNKYFTALRRFRSGRIAELRNIRDVQCERSKAYLRIELTLIAQLLLQQEPEDMPQPCQTNITRGEPLPLHTVPPVKPLHRHSLYSINKMRENPDKVPMYSWTDENGEKHFTNTYPPLGAKNIVESEGVAYVRPPMAIILKNKAIAIFENGQDLWNRYFGD